MKNATSSWLGLAQAILTGPLLVFGLLCFLAGIVGCFGYACLHASHLAGLTVLGAALAVAGWLLGSCER
jgi:hypothetical protein